VSESERERETCTHIDDPMMGLHVKEKCGQHGHCLLPRNAAGIRFVHEPTMERLQLASLAFFENPPVTLNLPSELRKKERKKCTGQKERKKYTGKKYTGKKYTGKKERKNYTGKKERQKEIYTSKKDRQKERKIPYLGTT
jgi:hypothetical protein